MAAVLLAVLGLALLRVEGASAAAGFVRCPLSQEGRVGGSVELHCEAMGSPLPEIQWWFEGDGPGDTSSQLWDGAWQDRVHIHTAYRERAASTMSIARLHAQDAGTYECRASNDPDRNHLTRPPRVKWVRAQASLVVLEPGTVSTEVTKSDSKVLLSCTLSGDAAGVTGHRWLRGDKVLHEDQETGLQMRYEASGDDRFGQYSCVFLPEDTGRAELSVPGPPRIKAVKKSEHANEGETVTLVCKSDSYPPVTSWLWYKVADTGLQVIVNGSESKFVVSHSEAKSELQIRDLDLEQDPGQYACNGTSVQGSDEVVVTLRVRSRLAALWPFLGIVAEVLVLVTVIFIYEKRRKPDEVLDEDDAGAAPLKSSGHHANDKGKHVRQRNAS
ncbi:basigin isoform X2 [Ochotona princeps]|uniref:basigin isoform X2 n=1 Tax=Ochotona princeps TaxID=9978 RepID=UPI002715466B|nr:basigin isoform X2 [Ochotona princeps]